MEFYDKVDDQYLNLIKHPLFLWRVKLELLDHCENTVQCIEQDIDYTNAGNISCNNTQGTRKSCSITLINVDLKYIPTEDSPFWFNRKFRLYIGLVDNRHYKQGSTNVRWTNETDTYWFSKGVYITSEIHVDSAAHTVSISGVDKYAQLDGTLNVLQADEMNTIFEYGSPIRDVITDILTLDMGNGQPLDPIDPIIETDRLNSVYLYKEFTLSAGQYYGDFLNELCTSYGAEIFYDNVGRLNFRRLFADDFPYCIGFRAPAHTFNYDLTGYQNAQETVKLTGINKIIVATDNVETPNGSYTAINNNPRSPLCFSKIGARTLPENGGIVIINAGNIVDEDEETDNENEEEEYKIQGESEELVVKRCRDYAEYRLMQETCLGTSISFTCPPYLHLNEGDVIAITDPDFGLDCDLYIINSITFPLGADSIQLEISNLAFLNSDASSNSQFAALTTAPIKFGIHYLLDGGSGTAPANQLIEMGSNFTTATDYDEENYTVSFSKANHELMSWTDNINGDTYDLNAEYAMPNQYFTLTANWANYEDYVLEYRVRNVAGAGYNYTFYDSINRQANGEDLYSTSFMMINNKKYYYYGRDFDSRTSLVAVVDNEMIIKNVWIPYSNDTVLSFNGNERTILYNGTNGGQTYYMKYPNAAEENVVQGFCSYLETLIFSQKLKRLISNGSTFPALKTVDFNDEGEFDVTSNSGSLFNSDVLETVTANHHANVSIFPTLSFIETHATTMAVPEVNFAGGVTITQNGSSTNPRSLFLNLTGDPTSTPTTITIGSTERNDPYMGGLELIRTNMIEYDNLGENVTIILDKLYMDSSAMVKDLNVGEIQFGGNIKLINGSELLCGTTLLTNNAPEFEGDLYIDSSNFAVGCSVTEIDLNSDVTITCTDSEFEMSVLTDNTSLGVVKFYGAVSIDCGGNAVSLLSGNTALTDVYFYDDTFSVANDSSATILQNNNANLTLHGIDGGNVQAYATAHSIPFEVIA